MSNSIFPTPLNKPEYSSSIRINQRLITICSDFQLDIENEVNNEMANRMSLFYAEATPMLKTLSNATTNFVTEVSLHRSRTPP